MTGDPRLADLGPSAYAELLCLRLQERYGSEPRQRRAALDLFDDNPPAWHSAVDAFEAFFRSLAPRRRSAFQRGIALALRRVQPGLFPPQGLVDLVLLAGSVQAFNAIEAMVDLVSDGGVWPVVVPALHVPILASLKGMARSGSAYKPAKRLLGELPHAAVFDAYEVLVVGRPRRWSGDFIELLPRFEAALVDGPPDVDDLPQWFGWRMHWLAAQRLAALTPPTLLEGLLHLHAYARADPCCTNEGHPLLRLVRALLGAAPGAPFERVVAADGITWLRAKALGDRQRVRWREDQLPRLHMLLPAAKGVLPEPRRDDFSSNPQVEVLRRALALESANLSHWPAECEAVA